MRNQWAIWAVTCTVNELYELSPVQSKA